MKGLLRTLILFALLTTLFAALGLAQSRSAGPSVTAKASAERVRFTAPSSVIQMKVEVISEGGIVVYDGGSRGNVFDWTLSGGDGSTLSDGSYLCVVTVKNLGGKLTQRAGTVVFNAGRAIVRAEGKPTILQEAAAGTIEEDARITVVGDTPSATVVSHDGIDGQVTATTGDLTFRTGDFFSGTETERMRIKADGTVDVAGMLRARDGFGFMNGTKLTVDEKGGLRVTSADGVNSPTVVGTGTVNRLAKWLETGGSGTLGDSLVYENGGFMGINTSTPGRLNGVQFATVPLHLNRVGNSAYMAVDAEGAGSYAGILLNRNSASANNHMWAIDAQPAAGLSSNLAISTYTDAGIPTARVTIDRSGQIFVGNTSGTVVTHPFESDTTGGGEAVRGFCLTANTNCYGIYGNAAAGDHSGYFVGGTGVYVTGSDDSSAAVDAYASGAVSYGLRGQSSQYRGGYIKAGTSGAYSLYVDTVNGPTQGTAGVNVNGAARVEGNLYVLGAKNGYVVDVMQNSSAQPLEEGDVVVLTGSSAPVLGSIPTATVRKADAAYDTSVAGIVDAVYYVPDAPTKAKYQAEQNALRNASAARMKAAREQQGDAKSANIPDPVSTITDDLGTVHQSESQITALQGGYVSVVTLGAYKTVKVDASFGAIHAGDLLTTSPNPGYAMKVANRTDAIGAIIGKALSDFSSGTGKIPVLVMPK